MDKLWTANISLNIDVVVVGTSESDAKFNLDIDDVIRDHSDEVDVDLTEIKNPGGIPAKWENLIPYGDDTDTSCDELLYQIIEKQEKDRVDAERDKKQFKLDLDI